MISLLPSWVLPKRNAPRLASRSTLPTLPCSPSTRAPCAPPSLVYAAETDGAWQRFLGWLLAPEPGQFSPPPNRLDAVRREFGAALADVDSTEAERLRWRLAHAVSLRDLWHLRSDVYNTIATVHSQAEAESRLLLINAHFPTRAPRSQFASL
jgi:hypothetical protein